MERNGGKNAHFHFPLLSHMIYLKLYNTHSSVPTFCILYTMVYHGIPYYYYVEDLFPYRFSIHVVHHSI